MTDTVTTALIHRSLPVADVVVETSMIAFASPPQLYSDVGVRYETSGYRLSTPDSREVKTAPRPAPYPLGAAPIVCQLLPGEMVPDDRGEDYIITKVDHTHHIDGFLATSVTYRSTIDATLPAASRMCSPLERFTIPRSPSGDSKLTGPFVAWNGAVVRFIRRPPSGGPYPKDTPRWDAETMLPRFDDSGSPVPYLLAPTPRIQSRMRRPGGLLSP